MSLISNLPTLRNMPTWGQRIVESFQDVQRQLSNISSQTNSSLEGSQSGPPQPLNSIHVDGGAGIYHVYLTDNNPNLYRGAEHTAYYSTTPDFSDYHPVHLGPARDLRVNLGLPGPLYWAAHHSYGPSSPPSALKIFGGSMPTPVDGSGPTAPLLRAGNGSGTNFPTQPPGGYGTFPHRGASPPKRS